VFPGVAFFSDQVNGAHACVSVEERNTRVIQRQRNAKAKFIT